MTKIIYKGTSYYIQTTGKYYQSRKPILGERLLHRRIWVEHNGKIPHGYHIHHIDHDWHNNNIENLVLVESKKHHSEHMKKRMQDYNYRKKAIKALRDSDLKARAWHKSDDGKAHHLKIAENLFKNRKKVKRLCGECDSIYYSYTRLQCSNKCWQRYRNRTK